MKSPQNYDYFAICSARILVALHEQFPLSISAKAYQGLSKLQEVKDIDPNMCELPNISFIETEDDWNNLTQREPMRRKREIYDLMMSAASQTPARKRSRLEPAQGGSATNGTAEPQAKYSARDCYLNNISLLDGLVEAHKGLFDEAKDFGDYRERSLSIREEFERIKEESKRLHPDALKEDEEAQRSNDLLRQIAEATTQFLQDTGLILVKENGDARLSPAGYQLMYREPTETSIRTILEDPRFSEGLGDGPGGRQKGFVTRDLLEVAARTAGKGVVDIVGIAIGTAIAHAIRVT